jgi:carboxyl-terminal processing protease
MREREQRIIVYAGDIMRKYLWIVALFIFSISEAKVPEIDANDVTMKAKEIMKSHASQKKLTPVLAQRILNNYLEELDPNKTYFIESDIEQWIHPSEELLNQLIKDYDNSNFEIFENIHSALIKAIERRRFLEQGIDYSKLPSHVKPEEFKDLEWAKTENELVRRIERIKALQLETAAKLTSEMREKSLQRIQKRQTKYEEEILTDDPVEKERMILSYVLKATASALDTHTAYFTPDEATQFMITVQQRLFGIGAQLRDDISGFTVIKIVEGGPAALGKELKEGDRIIAVNGEPVVGMDIIEAVDLIRGEENTPVVLTVIREETDESGTKTEKKLDITLMSLSAMELSVI